MRWRVTRGGTPDYMPSSKCRGAWEQLTSGVMDTQHPAPHASVLSMRGRHSALLRRVLSSYPDSSHAAPDPVNRCPSVVICVHQQFGWAAVPGACRECVAPPLTGRSNQLFIRTATGRAAHEQRPCTMDSSGPLLLPNCE